MKMIKIKRRNLLQVMGIVGIGAVFSPGIAVTRSGKSLKILVLGGTGFIGPHIVREALKRGHQVTMFNRGRSNTGLFPEVNKLLGDRDGGLDSLRTGQWDAVIDNSGYVPRLVRDSAELLKDRVGRYLYTSSISAYDLSDREYPLTPASKLNDWTSPNSEDVWTHYGEFKAQCERVVENIYRDRALIVRPTYIVGPGDTTQRFTWWVDRVNRGAEILAPGNPDTSIEIIDVRDLAGFYIRLLEDQRSGAFNATGPAGRLSFGGMLHGIRATGSQAVDFTWVDADFLNKHDVDGRDMPMWSAGDDGFTGRLTSRQSSIEAGLAFRPLARTVEDTLNWHRQLPIEEQAFTKVGIDHGKEERVLAAWNKRKIAGGQE